MPKLEEFMELGMDTVLAPYVAGMGGGIATLNGTFIMNGATNVVVGNTRLRAGDHVIFTLVTPGGAVGDPPSIKTRTNGTGFQVAGTAGDTSVYAYRILQA